MAQELERTEREAQVVIPQQPQARRVEQHLRPVAQAQTQERKRRTYRTERPLYRWILSHRARCLDRAPGLSPMSLNITTA